MKINILSFEHEIDFNEGLVQVLEIEDKQLFSSITFSINELCKGNKVSENILIIDEDNVQDFSKKCLIFFDVFNFDYNQKRVLTALYKRIESNYQIEDELKGVLEGVNRKLVQNVIEVTSEFDFEIDYSYTPVVNDYLKLLRIKINNDQFDSQFNKVIGILELVETFKLCEVIILVNVKKFFTNKEMVEIYKFCNYRKIKLLLIEFGLTDELVKYESKLQIDSDYFEMKSKH